MGLEERLGRVFGTHCHLHPINTVAAPKVMVPPCAVLSPMRAAGFPPMNTVAEPAMMESGGPVQVQRLPTVAAGFPSMVTVGTPGGITGPPTWGLGPSERGHVCMSPILAAAGMVTIV